MPQRAIWRGAISFGLIYVPVEVFSASREHQLSLHFLDNRDFEPVGYERINKTTGKSVDWGHIVKGYEYEKGKYVALSDADFKHANLKASETIDVESFTQASEISPVYFDTPYYLKPSKGGEKVYALLAQAMAGAKRVAIATFVMRGRQHLCAIMPQKQALILLTLRFADQIASIDAIAPATKSPKIKDAELGMALRLVEEMTRKWSPGQFHDTYREDLMRRIKEKIASNQVHELAKEPKSQRPKAQVIDLMDALKRSLATGSKRAPQKAHAARSAKSRKRA